MAGCGQNDPSKNQSSAEPAESSAVSEASVTEESEQPESKPEKSKLSSEDMEAEPKIKPIIRIDSEKRIEYYDDFAKASEESNWVDGSTITLLEDVSCDANIVVSGKKTLDLNGHKLTMLNGGGTAFTVKGGSLTVQDSAKDGEMLIEKGMHLIDAAADGELIINGGILTGESTEDYALIGVGEGGTVTVNDGVLRRTDSNAVSMSGSGTLNLAGGYIECNSTSSEPGVSASLFVWKNSKAVVNWSGTVVTTASGFALYPENEDALSELNLKDSPRINGKGINLQDSYVINVAGKLSNTTPINVTMTEPRVFTSGLSGNGSAENFGSDEPDYKISLNSSGEAELVK